MTTFFAESFRISLSVSTVKIASAVPCVIFLIHCVGMWSESLHPVNSCSSVMGIKKIVLKISSLPFSLSRTPTNMKFNHLSFLSVF